MKALSTRALLRTAALGLLLIVNPATAFDARNYCGDEGVWVQILGAGGPEINDGAASASYLVWKDGKALVLVDPGPGSSVLFDLAQARYEDLEVVLFSHLHVDHVADFPAFVKGGSFLERERPLRVLGPDGAGPYPDTETFVDRMIGPNGAFAYLAGRLRPGANGRIIAENIPSRGRRTWSRYGTETLTIAAVPVSHGDVPALAYRVDIDGQRILFTGDFNGSKNLVPELGKDADVLVVHHAIPETARGRDRELHALPSQIGRIAAQINPRFVILSHRMSRTRGVESLSRQAIEAEYNGSLLFANDLECWGL